MSISVSQGFGALKTKQVVWLMVSSGLTRCPGIAYTQLPSRSDSYAMGLSNISKIWGSLCAQLISRICIKLVSRCHWWKLFLPNCVCLLPPIVPWPTSSVNKHHLWFNLLSPLCESVVSLEPFLTQMLQGGTVLRALGLDLRRGLDLRLMPVPHPL